MSYLEHLRSITPCHTWEQLRSHFSGLLQNNATARSCPQAGPKPDQSRTESGTESGPSLGPDRTKAGPSPGPDRTEAGPSLGPDRTEDGPKLDQRWTEVGPICDCFCFLLGQRSVNNFGPNSVQLRSKFCPISVKLRSNFETIPGPPGVQCLPDQIWKQNVELTEYKSSGAKVTTEV